MEDNSSFELMHKNSSDDLREEFRYRFRKDMLRKKFILDFHFEDDGEISSIRKVTIIDLDVDGKDSMKFRNLYDNAAVELYLNLLEME